MKPSEKRKKEILDKLKDFVVLGHSWVDDQLRVNVTGMVRNQLHKQSHGILPVKFGKIQGDVIFSNMGLEELGDAMPTEVTGKFHVGGNHLKTLEGLPSGFIGLIAYANQLTDRHGLPQTGVYHLDVRRNPLLSLNGLPNQPGIVSSMHLTYDPQLPLLHTLVCEHVTVSSDDPEYASMCPHVNDILEDKRWMGKGKKGSLMCAAALIKSGFEGNAKW